MRNFKTKVHDNRGNLTRPLIFDALPSLVETTAVSEGWRWHTLCKIVGLLFLRVHFYNGHIEIWVINDGPEPMELDCIVFSTWCDALLSGKHESTVVVFMDAGAELTEGLG